VVFEVLGRHEGREVVRAAVDLPVQDVLQPLVFGGKEAEAHTGPHDLGERADVDDRLRVHSVEAGRRRNAEQQVGVAVVIDHRDAVALRCLQQLLAAVHRHHRARGVLVGTDAVDELRHRPLAVEVLQRLLQRVRFHALVVDWDADHVGAVLAEAADRAGVGELLRDNRVAGLEEGLAAEANRLHRPRGQRHVVDGHVPPVVLGEAHSADLAQRRVPALVRVEHQLLAVALQDALRRLQQLGRGEGTGVGVAGAEVIHAHRTLL
jgi:hypothetical protein